MPAPASSLRTNKKDATPRPHRSKAGVRFSEQTEMAVEKDENGVVTTNVTSRRMKRPRHERPNADEIDDVDDYKPDEDDYDVGDNRNDIYGSGGGNNASGRTSAQLPGESQTLAAKRQRRLKSAGDEGVEDEDGHATSIDKETSLASEGVAIEPFHMKEEKTDGTGYFDGDTYVFRQGGQRNANEEEDAWLDNLDNTAQGDEEEEAPVLAPKNNRKENPSNKMDSWSKEELYAKVLPLVSDTETVARALIRYGNLLKQEQKQQKHPPKASKTFDKESENSIFDDDNNTDNMAKQALNDLTEAASALLLKGDVSIYQHTRRDILKLLPSPSSLGDLAATSTTTNNPSTSAAETTVQWQYQGNNDQQIHGPYSTEQMQGWIQQGYFVGPTAVNVRTVLDTPVPTPSMQDDLLKDLLEEEEDGNDGGDQKKKAPQKPPEHVFGEWILSDQVNFSQYM